jgi:hypothetical protein
VEHPFELQIADLQSIDFELVDLDDTATTQIAGGTATLSRAAEGGGSFPTPTKGLYEAGGGGGCFLCHFPQHPRRHPRVIPLITAENQPTPATTGRFASQAAYDAYINSPDFNPDMLAVI